MNSVLENKSNLEVYTASLEPYSKKKKAPSNQFRQITAKNTHYAFP